MVLRFLLPSCHTLREQGHGSPAGDTASPGVFAQALARPPICQRQNVVHPGFGIGGYLLAELDVSLFSLLLTVGLGFSLMGFTSAEVLFVWCIQVLGFFCSFYP